MGVDYTAPMRIVVAGGTGFLGRPLRLALDAGGHDVVTLSRGGTAGFSVAQWQPDGTVGPWARVIDGADVVINLAGESIAAGRWTAARKKKIRESRIQATRSIRGAIAAAARQPRLLINGSAVGYYGARGDEVVTEETAPGTDFLSEVAREWEAEAAAAESPVTRVVMLRTGIVLERDGGALAEMIRPFQFFLGGPLGTGRQYMPWIHRADWIALVRFLVRSEFARGAFNATAPAPVTNAEFTTVLARALHRPAVLRAPAPMLKVILGEMAGPLLLTGQRAVPAKALEMGFAFTYANLDAALKAILG